MQICGFGEFRSQRKMLSASCSCGKLPSLQRENHPIAFYTSLFSFYYTLPQFYHFAIKKFSFLSIKRLTYHFVIIYYCPTSNSLSLRSKIQEDGRGIKVKEYRVEKMTQLKKIRQEAGITAAELARRLHVTRGCVCLAEKTGIRTPRTAAKYATAFPGKTWLDLMDTPPPPEQKTVTRKNLHI